MTKRDFQSTLDYVAAKLGEPTLEVVTQACLRNVAVFPFLGFVIVNERFLSEVNPAGAMAASAYALCLQANLFSKRNVRLRFWIVCSAVLPSLLAVMAASIASARGRDEVLVAAVPACVLWMMLLLGGYRIYVGDVQSVALRRVSQLVGEDEATRLADCLFHGRRRRRAKVQAAIVAPATTNHYATWLEDGSC